MKKILIGALSLIALIPKSGFCDGPLSTPGAVAVVESHGNNFRGIAVAQSTQSAILISSAAVSSGLGVDWRFREIINCSNGDMMIMGSRTEFSSFSSTKAVVISSGTAFKGESWKSYGQGPIWAWWNPETTQGGACGSEHYFKK